MKDNSDKPDYTGKRALLLTRVSTPKQIEMYGHAWQEMQIRKLLIEPLGLQLDEKHHIIRDTYTGLEFRHREALTRILEMAERGEIDVVCMEVLDRGLGRKGLPREMFRMQLRELGVRILTTDPNEHADDDSLIGEMIRLIKGYKAEEEINDLVRRTMGGKRAKAEGRQKDGIIGEKKIVGNGPRLYGYTFLLDEHGRKVGYELNLEVICVDAEGTEWTEVMVVQFIFNQLQAGTTIRQVAKLLNEKDIPPATVVRGTRVKRVGIPLWQPSSINNMIRNSAYWGAFRQFRTRTVEKKPGQKYKPRRATPEEDQVIIAVPAIVTKEVANTVLKKLRRNQKQARRNNKKPEESLLRAGLIICGECQGNMSVIRDRRKEDYYVHYKCNRFAGLIGRCVGTQITAHLVDDAAWERAVEIIRDPSQVEAKIKHLTTDNSLTKHRERTRTNLAEIRRRQASLRKDLSEMSQEGKLDKGTREYLSGQLQILAKQEEEAKEQQAKEQAFQKQYNELVLTSWTYYLLL